jgi:pyruvate kinase
MARFRPVAKILGFSPNPRAVQQLSLSWGTRPLYLDELATTEAMVAAAMSLAQQSGEVRSGDLVAVLSGSDPSQPATDTLRMIRVP